MTIARLPRLDRINDYKYKHDIPGPGESDSREQSDLYVTVLHLLVMAKGFCT